MREVDERGRTDGVPADLIADGTKITEALVLGRQYRPKPLEGEQQFVEFVDAAMEARLARFEDGLRFARTAADSITRTTSWTSLTRGA